MDLELSGIEAEIEEEVEESYSAAQVLTKLERAWMNEKLAPDLLEHHMEFVDVMLEQLKELEVMINQTSNKNDLRVSTHLMEMDRIKYIVSDYLRCRLKKIEQFALHIISDPNEQSKLTESELAFANGFWTSIKTHLEHNAFRHMPDNVKNLNQEKMVVKPEYYSYVFLKANKPVTGVSANEPGSIEEEVIDFDTNDQQLLPYKCVEHLISNSSVHLI